MWRFRGTPHYLGQQADRLGHHPGPGRPGPATTRRSTGSRSCWPSSASGTTRPARRTAGPCFRGRSSAQIRGHARAVRAGVREAPRPGGARRPMLDEAWTAFGLPPPIATTPSSAITIRRRPVLPLGDGTVGLELTGVQHSHKAEHPWPTRTLCHGVGHDVRPVPGGRRIRSPREPDHGSGRDRESDDRGDLRRPAAVRPAACWRPARITSSSPRPTASARRRIERANSAHRRRRQQAADHVPDAEDPATRPATSTSAPSTGRPAARTTCTRPASRPRRTTSDRGPDELVPRPAADESTQPA